jgi:hypothetical protein
VVDSSKFERAFGWKATALSDAVAATVAWVQTQARSWQSGDHEALARSGSRRKSCS